MRLLSRRLRTWGVSALTLALMAIAAAPGFVLAAERTYNIDTRQDNKAYVIAYEALTYSIDGGTPVSVSANSVTEITSTALPTNTLASIVLSSSAGYVVVVSDDSDYQTSNTSNDQMITARGKNRFVDTDFLVYNHIGAVPGGTSPAKMVITAWEANATVDIVDLTNSNDSDHFIVGAGGSDVVSIQDPSLLMVTSDNPISIYYGILHDGFCEVVPTANGGFVGTEAVVSCPNMIGVVSLGDGQITITERQYGQVEITHFEGEVSRGEAIYFPALKKIVGNRFTGSAAVRVSGTVPFYTYTGLKRSGAIYYGGTFIPASPDADPGTEFYVSSLDAHAQNRLDVYTWQTGTTVEIAEVGNPSNTLTPETTSEGMQTYILPASELTNPAGGKVTTTWRISTNNPVSVYQRHEVQYENGGIVIEPDDASPLPPSIANFTATAVHVVPDADEPGTRQTYLRIKAIVQDLNRNLVSVTVTGPGNQTITLPQGSVTNEAGMVSGQYSRIMVETGYENLEYPYTPGAYTLTATDASGLTVSRTRVISNVSVSDLVPALETNPAVGAKSVDLSPIYSWFPPGRVYASQYRIQVSGDSEFAISDSTVLGFNQTRTYTSGFAQGQVPDLFLNRLQHYYWRVMSIAYSLDHGEVVAVIGPTWSFETRGAPDTTPPRFTFPPTALPSALDTVSIGFKTDEPTQARIVYGLPGWREDGILSRPAIILPTIRSSGSARDTLFATGHLTTFLVEGDPGRYEYVVIVNDARGNTTTSERSSFLVSLDADETPPSFSSGPDIAAVCETKARIAWETDEPCIGEIRWWAKGINPTTMPDSVKVKRTLGDYNLEGDVEISPLLPDTVYYFKVTVFDRADNDTTSLSLSLRTRAAPDDVKPSFIGQSEERDIGVDHATIVFTTDEPCYARVIFDSSAIMSRSQASEVTHPVKTHRVELRDLAPATQYTYAAVVYDAARNRAVSIPRTFSTRPTPDEVAPQILPLGNGGLDKGRLIPANPALGIRWPQAQWTSNEENVGWVEVSTLPDLTEDSTFANRDSIQMFSATNYSTSHTVTLRNLVQGKDYWAMIFARDQIGNQSRGLPLPFSMPAEIRQDTIPPALMSINHVQGSDQWELQLELSEDAAVRVIYGTLHYRLNRTVVSIEPKRLHNILLTELTPATEYYFNLEIRDRAGNVKTFAAPRHFRTLAWPEENPPSIVNGPGVIYSSTNKTIIAFAADRPVAAKIYWRLKNRPDLFAETAIPSDGDRWMSNEHQIEVYGLGAYPPGTEFDFALVITDAGGRTLTFPDNTTLVRTARGVQLQKSARVSAGRMGTGSFCTSSSPDVTPPVITGGPTVTAAGTGWVTVNWRSDEVANSAVRYTVIQRDQVGRVARPADGELDNEQSDNTIVVDHVITISGTGPGAQVTYETTSTDPSGNGETTSEQQVFTTPAEEDVTAPVVTEGPEIISKSDTRAVVRWVTNEPADSQVDVLEIDKPIEERKTFSTSDKVTEHVVTLTNLTAETVYDYLISSADRDGNGPTTSLSRFVTEAAPDVEAPTLVEAPEVVNVDDATATITWKTNEAADTYIEYGASTSFGLTFQETDRTTDHRVVLTNLTGGTGYYFRVQAEDASGNVFTQATPGQFTTTVADNTPPATPTSLAAIPGNNAVQISWDANTESDFAGYSIEKSTDGTNYNLVATQYQETSYVDPLAANGTNYTYRVWAVDNSRNRNASAKASVSVTPAASYALDAPQLDPTYYIYYYYNPYHPEIQPTGEVFRPILRARTVAPPASRPNAKMTYNFVIAADPEFKGIVATGSYVPPNDSLVGTMESWEKARIQYWWYDDLTSDQYTALGWTEAYYNAARDYYQSVRDTTQLVPLQDTTAWVPSRPITSGAVYYWRVRANDGIFDGPWSATGVYDASQSNTLVLLHPGRATYNYVNLRPEEGALERPTSIALTSFAATGSQGGIALSWDIHHDGEVGAVYLSRATTTDPSDFTRVNQISLATGGRFVDTEVLPGVEYLYRLEVALAEGGVQHLGLVQGSMTGPEAFRLLPNYPNPFNPVTVVPYSLPDASFITMKIYDVNGRLVRTLLNNTSQTAGFYRITWDGLDDQLRSVGSGVYVCRVIRTPLEGGQVQTITRRMLLVK